MPFQIMADLNPALDLKLKSKTDPNPGFKKKFRFHELQMENLAKTQEPHMQLIVKTGKNTNVTTLGVRDSARIKYKLMGFMVYF